MPVRIMVLEMANLSALYAQKDSEKMVVHARIAIRMIRALTSAEYATKQMFALSASMATISIGTCLQLCVNSAANQLSIASTASSIKVRRIRRVKDATLISPKWTGTASACSAKKAGRSTRTAMINSSACVTRF